jgi:serine/threonine protein kinase
MKYPLRGEYDTAVRNLDKFVLDSVLKVGKPAMQPQNPNLLRSSNGGKAIVYEITANTKKYAIKCWVEDLGDLKIRYKAIDEYLKKVKLPYFVDFSYNEQGILVNGQKFPIIRMEWIDGISFRRFLANNINNPALIRDFAEKFLEMVKVLHQNNISHGDLQHGNIMVRKNGTICLIDYDSLYVPQLRNEKDHIKGIPGYQHPNRNKLIKLSPKSDYFSELIIYLSLLAISEKPSYWKKIEQEERLLFSDKDLDITKSPQIFAELKNLSDEVQYFTLELEKFCREPDIEKLQPLEDLVTAYTGSKVSWDFVPNAIPNLSATSTIPAPIPIDLKSSGWDILATNTTKSPTVNKSTTVNVPSSDPWSKLDTSQSKAWDKLDGNKTPTNAWDKFGQLDQSKKTESATEENSWNKFDNMWNKLLKSVSSVWNGFLKWFN